MISIEKAKQLKDLGLKWIPQDGDFYIPEKSNTMEEWMEQAWSSWTEKPCLVGVLYHYEELDYKYFDFDKCKSVIKQGVVWLPKLNQLLSEVKKHDKYFQVFTSTDKYGCGIGCGN